MTNPAAPEQSASDTLCPGCFAAKGHAPVCPQCGYDEREPIGPLVLPPRTRLQEQFVIGRVLGKPGGFGITYLGWDLRLETRVAIKEYLPRDLATRESGGIRVIPHARTEGEIFRDGLKQFLGEARTLARLDHPNIVRVRQFFGANQTAYLVMDYYEGLSLAEYLERQGGRLPEQTARLLILPVLDGLRAVHAQGFLHRDIKPQNIYLARTPSGGTRPILLDFGTARQAIGERSRSLSGVITVGYAPYEQYLRKGRQGAWTDLYAIGAVLYRMVTGEVPPEAIERRDADDLKPATAYGVSAELSAILADTLAVAPEDRPQTVQALQARLSPKAPAPDGVTDSSALKSAPVAATTPFTGWRVWIGATALVMLAVGLWGALQWQMHETQRQRDAAELAAQRQALEAEFAALKRQREEAERQDNARRMAELAAQQAIEQMRMQDLQRLREEAEKATETLRAVQQATEGRLAEQRRQREEREPFEQASMQTRSSSAYPPEYGHIFSASYRCTGKLSNLERLICENPSLARADGVMGAIYRELRAMLTPELADQLRNSQRDWIKQRNRDCIGSMAEECVLNMTNQQIAEMLALKRRLLD